MLNGNFVTTVPYDFPGGEYVKKVELLYRVDSRYEYYIPYYRFFVELPEAEREGDAKVAAQGARFYEQSAKMRETAEARVESAADFILKELFAL